VTDLEARCHPSLSPTPSYYRMGYGVCLRRWASSDALSTSGSIHSYRNIQRQLGDVFWLRGGDDVPQLARGGEGRPTNRVDGNITASRPLKPWKITYSLPCVSAFFRCLTLRSSYSRRHFTPKDYDWSRKSSCAITFFLIPGQLETLLSTNIFSKRLLETFYFPQKHTFLSFKTKL
jgi:hypothetical protein